MGRNIAACNDKKINHTRVRQRKNQANCLQRKRDKMEDLKKTIAQLDSNLLGGFEQFNKLYEDAQRLYSEIYAYYKQTGYMDPTSAGAFEKLQEIRVEIKALEDELNRFNQKAKPAPQDNDEGVPYEDTDHTVPSF